MRKQDLAAGPLTQTTLATDEQSNQLWKPVTQEELKLLYSIVPEPDKITGILPEKSVRVFTGTDLLSITDLLCC